MFFRNVCSFKLTIDVFWISEVLIKNFWHCADNTLKFMHCIIHSRTLFFYVCYYKLHRYSFLFLYIPTV